MRTIYRLARKNIADDEVDVQTGKTLIDILRIISATHKDSELEQRLEVLESKNR